MRLRALDALAPVGSSELEDAAPRMRHGLHSSRRWLAWPKSIHAETHRVGRRKCPEVGQEGAAPHASVHSSARGWSALIGCALISVIPVLTWWKDGVNDHLSDLADDLRRQRAEPRS